MVIEKFRSVEKLLIPDEVEFRAITPDTPIFYSLNHHFHADSRTLELYINLHLTILYQSIFFSVPRYNSM